MEMDRRLAATEWESPSLERDRGLSRELKRLDARLEGLVKALLAARPKSSL
jgi:hypothetical protein